MRKTMFLTVLSVALLGLLLTPADSLAQQRSPGRLASTFDYSRMPAGCYNPVFSNPCFSPFYYNPTVTTYTFNPIYYPTPNSFVPTGTYTYLPATVYTAPFAAPVYPVNNYLPPLQYQGIRP